MVCTNCGALIPAENLACPACGRRRAPDQILGEHSPPVARKLVGVGGWLFLLVAQLVFLVPISAAVFLAARAYGLFVTHSIKINPSPIVLFAWVGWPAVTAFGFYAGTLLWKERPGAVAVTKRFLLAGLLLSALAALLPHRPVSDRAWDLVNALFWFCVWYSYLAFSKRVANTYPC